jgi:DNA-directed RNA polymerase specialized sigma24 family protein
VETLPQTDPSRHERFVALTELVAAPLHRYALRRIDGETAEDVVADALLVLWRRLDEVRSMIRCRGPMPSPAAVWPTPDALTVARFA